MNKQSIIPNPRIPKKETYVKGFTPMREFNKEQYDETNAPKPKQSWRVWINQKQWTNDLEKLNPVQRCILIDLKFYQRTKFDCYPSAKKIATDLKVAPHTIWRNLPIMVKLGKIKIVKQPGRVSRYKVIDF